MTCCGEERDSRFCPDCGKQLREASPLGSLLVYLRAQTAARSTRLANYVENGAPPKRQTRCEFNRDKWKSWVAALESLLKETGH